MDKSTQTTLALISQRAHQEPRFVFTSLAHRLNGEFLGDCYRSLGKDRAGGIDGRSWQEHGEQLDANLTDLVARLKATGCRPHLLHIPLANFPYHRGGKSYIVLLPAWL